MKKLRFSALFAVALCTAIFAARTVFASGAKPRIGISFASLQEERWSREKKIFEAVARENNADLVIQVANSDENAQNQQIENLVTQGVDVLIVIPQNRNSVVPAIKAAKAENIPTIAYDRFIPSKDLALYVSFDSVKVGEAQAKALVAMKPAGNYLWLGGHPADDNAHLVRKGQMNILKPYIDKGKIKLIAEQWCEGWSPQEALKHTENALTANKNKIDAVLASNDGTAGGAIQALAAQKLAGVVPVSGQDAELSAVQRIAEGTQAVTILKDFRVLVRETIKAAVELTQKKKPSKINSKVEGVDAILLDVVPVTKANLETTIIKTGFHDKKDVYKYVKK